jgi:hypothetical protein
MTCRRREGEEGHLIIVPGWAAQWAVATAQAHLICSCRAKHGPCFLGPCRARTRPECACHVQAHLAQPGLLQTSSCSSKKTSLSLTNAAIIFVVLSQCRKAPRPSASSPIFLSSPSLLPVLVSTCNTSSLAPSPVPAGDRH